MFPIHTSPLGQDIGTCGGQLTAVPSHVLCGSNVESWHEVTGPQGVVPPATTLSAGHAAEDPVQFSATSQTPADARQGVVFGRNPSAGHAAEDPVQFSATSQTPADARQGVVADANPSAGQVAEVPVQFSAMSQMPADVRQGVVAGAKPLAGQVAEVPLHFAA